MNQTNNQTQQSAVSQEQQAQQTYYNYTSLPIKEIKETKNKFLTFAFSLMPGACQMYHGLMRRGIALMTAFFGIIAIAAALYTLPIALVLPVIWFYSFFDGINRMNFTLDELKAVKDEWPLISSKPSEKLTLNLKNKHALIGGIVIVIGIFALLAGVLNDWYFWSSVLSEYQYEIFREVVNFIPKLIIPIVCIFIGVKLLKGKKEKQVELNVETEVISTKEQ